MTAEERFELAKTMFNNKDYIEAKTQFKILTLNNHGVQFIDEAQYLLAECHFNLSEYILASDEYGRLLRFYPRSKWVDDAQYKIAFSNYKLSPKPALDQKYTVKAIESFQSFLEDFPDSELVPEAERLLLICRTKLSEKEYKAGKLYLKLKDREAALVYFTSVIDNYYDTKYLQDALFWKGESLFKLKRNDEAQSVFLELLSKYPQSKYVAKTKSRLKDIESNVVKIRQANGVSSGKKQ